MRHLSREEVRADRLLEQARTIAAVGGLTAPRDRATLAYLRRVGYDVRLLPTPLLSNIGGPIDLVLVLAPLPGLPRLLRDAAAKGADGIWFTGAGPDRAARALARQLGLTLVTDADIVGRRQRGFREAGEPAKLGIRPRRRGRPDKPEGRLSSRTGWKEAGGGGKRGGGGGRAAIDEKKMDRSRPRRHGRRRASGRRAA